MTDMRLTRRDALLSFLVFPFVGGLATLPGCVGGEKELPVIDSKKPKDELQLEIENPYGVPAKRSKSKRK